jgi:aminoglycoside phosphotransferase (APT) family kinase protein
MSAVADVVRSHDDATRHEREPLLVLEPLETFLDSAGLGAGPIQAAPLGDGHSNVTYALRRGDVRLVLRRPPRGPLPPSAHDVLREARLLRALAPAGVRVPEILAVCEDPAVIGAPFYVMPFLDGHVLTTELPPGLDATGIGPALVDALAELHEVDAARPELAGFGRPTGYLERQVRRFRGLLEHNATRPLPELDRVADWLDDARPPSPPTTVVHGDYRLGNVMLAPDAPPRVTAMLDWELATLGDPLADLGYLIATWAEPDDPPNPMLDLSGLTRRPGFARRADLIRAYHERTGRPTDGLAYYEVLALWKSAIFLEGSYKRHVAGTTDDPYFARLGDGVPALARAAAARAAAA